MSAHILEVVQDWDGKESPSRGIFSDFEGYVTPTENDYKELLNNGLVVVDANVLLNLYRYNDVARDALLEVLSRLGNQLWVPHQVVAEFWRNREGVLRDPRDTQKTVRELGEHRDRAVRAFRTWANRVSLPDERSTELVTRLTDAFAAVIDGVDALDMEEATVYARDTSADAVLQRLAAALEGRCGEPLPVDQHKDAVAEAIRRVDGRIPPGYMDKKKDDESAAGDYLVWEQVLIEAGKRKRDVLFVTGDVKEDWWREESGERRGPRLELVQEMRERAGVRLFMLRPTSLLEHARKFLGVDVQPESVQEVARVEEFLSQRDDTATSGWDLRTIRRLVERLDFEAPVQAEVLRLAAKQGGFVSRQKVYEIGGYAEERSLRGFTRPVNRIVQDLKAEGLIDKSAVDVIAARYEGAVSATGFDVPQELLLLISEVEPRRTLYVDENGSLTSDEQT